MAKQSGPVYITGTYNGICFYKMNGAYYARQKSSLSGKRVKKDKAFTLTMVYAGIFGQASEIAGEVYRSLDGKQRKHALYRAMTSRANKLLKEGLDAGMVKARLLADCIPPAKAVQPAGSPISAAERLTNTPPKTMRIANNRNSKRPLLRDRKGKLYVSAQGLISSLDDDGKVVMDTPSHRAKRKILPGAARALPLDIQ